MFKFKTYAKAEVVQDKDDSLKKALAGHVDMPTDAPFDLLFFKAIYLTSGANLNYTYFDKDELIKSIDTVANKAMDIEHEEQGIVGHIYAASFFEADSTKSIDIDTLKSYEDKVDVVIAGVVYKDRFPELASEVTKGEWYVSMETYYDSFDIKIGDVLLDSKTATTLGVVDLIGQEVTLKKSDETIAVGTANKLVRNLHFSGGGFVKEPANPTSVILDTSGNKVINLSVASKGDAGDFGTDTKVDFYEVLKFVEGTVLEYIKNEECFDCKEIIKDIDIAINSVSCVINKELAKKWTTKYINSLPNSSFIIIEQAYKSGKTDDKRARHLPYKDKEGKVDLPHLSNALARCNQLVPVTDSISQADLRSKACSKAQSLGKKHLKKKK